MVANDLYLSVRKMDRSIYVVGFLLSNKLFYVIFESHAIVGLVLVTAMIPTVFMGWTLSFLQDEGF